MSDNYMKTSFQNFQYCTYVVLNELPICIEGLEYNWKYYAAN